VVAWWQLPCNIVTAGSSQCKVWKWWQKRKKVTINWRSGSASGGMVALLLQAVSSAKRKWWQKKETFKLRSSIVSGGVVAYAMQHCCGRQQTVQSLEVAAKKEKR